jgi:hypothetical protein
MTVVPLVTAALAATTPDAPERVSHVYEQHLDGAPERVLPLLTPLGERAWARGWEPEMRWEPPGGGAGTLFVIRHPGQPPPAPGGRPRSGAGAPHVQAQPPAPGGRPRSGAEAPHVQAQDTVWLLDSWEPAAGHVHYVHVTPGSDVTEIDIRLRPDGKERTVATVRYTWTALGAPGVALVRSKTPESYRQFMGEWELELNHFLTTGKKRSAAH